MAVQKELIRKPSKVLVGQKRAAVRSNAKLDRRVILRKIFILFHYFISQVPETARSSIMSCNFRNACSSQ